MRRIASIATLTACSAFASATSLGSPGGDLFAPADAQPVVKAPEAPRKEAWVVTVATLDSTRAGTEFEAAFRRAAELTPPAVVLVVRADVPSRADVLRTALLAMKDCAAPILVQIERASPRDVSTTPAAIAIGLAANHWSDPLDKPRDAKVLLASEAAARELVDGKVPWASYETDVRELLAPKIAGRGWAARSADLLFWPRETWWGVTPSAGGTWTLTTGAKPATAESERAELLAENLATTDRALEVPLAAVAGDRAPGRSPSWTQLCLVLKVKASSTPDVHIKDTLEDVRREVVGLEAQVRQTVAGLDDTLDAFSTGKLSEKRPQQSQREALELMLSRGETALRDAEALLAKHPELLRTVPPGKTAVSAKPSSQPARWRTLLDGYRKDLGALRTRLDKLKGV